MKWHVELDPHHHFEDIWVLMCHDQWMLIGSSNDLRELHTLCKLLNEMDVYAYSGS